MNKGYIFSGIGHLGLILWALLGGWLFSAQAVPEIRSMNVSIISGAELDALASQAPKVVDAAPVAVAQPAASAPVSPPAAPADPVPPPPAPDSLPQAAMPQPDPVPQPVAPPASAPQPIAVAPSPLPPKPRPAAKISDQPADQVPDTPKIADQPVPKQTDTPTPTPETPKPPKPPATTEPTTPVITPEAAPSPDPAPALAPTTSKRPQSRPKLAAVKPPDTPAPDTTAADQAAADQAKADKAAADKAAKVAANQAADQAAIDAAVAAATQGAAGGADSAASGPPMTSGEIDGLRVAIKKCWNLSTVSSAAMQTTVTVRLNVMQDGTPDGPSIRMTGFTGGSEATAKPLYEAAFRAIVRCGKDGFPLPADKYDTWKDLELVFDPSGMRLR